MTSKIIYVVIDYTLDETLIAFTSSVDAENFCVWYKKQHPKREVGAEILELDNSSYIRLGKRCRTKAIK